MFADFDGFVILSHAVVCEQKMEASASMSCRQGSDLRLSWASVPKSSLISSGGSKDQLLISSDFSFLAILSTEPANSGCRFPGKAV